nr:hypothetical protein CFP56_32479 [Quercus suber]
MVLLEAVHDRDEGLVVRHCLHRDDLARSSDVPPEMRGGIDEMEHIVDLLVLLELGQGVFREVMCGREPGEGGSQDDNVPYLRHGVSFWGRG